ncbi:hypothetical protein KCU95_g1480, partial [Aureobasidium melanogenum]
MPPRRDSREAVLQNHHDKATDRTTTWALLSRSQHRDPPCTKPLADLKILRLSNLRMGSKASRSAIIVRTICQPRHPGPLLPVLNVIEDDAGRAMHIEIYFSSTIPVATVLAIDNVLATKAPRQEMGKYGPKIRIVHPSDIMLLPQGHELMPKAFSSYSDSASKTIWDWKEQAKEAIKRDEYTKAIDYYSNAIKRASETQQSSDLSGALHYKRSIAAMRAGHYDLSFSDARVSLRDCSDEDNKNGGRKFLYQAAYTACQKHNFPQAHSLLERLLKLLPENNRAHILREDVAARLREERHGYYDIAAIHKEQMVLDHASFVNLTEIEHHLVADAFGYAQPVGASNKNAYSSRDQGAQLWINVVQRIFANPSQARRLLALHASPPYKPPKRLLVVDGQAIVEVFQVKDIIDHNSFSYEVSPSTKHAHCLYIQASYMNHSCVENTFRSFINDMIFIRATNDM